MSEKEDPEDHWEHGEDDIKKTGKYANFLNDPDQIGLDVTDQDLRIHKKKY